MQADNAASTQPTWVRSVSRSGVSSRCGGDELTGPVALVWQRSGRCPWSRAGLFERAPRGALASVALSRRYRLSPPSLCSSSVSLHLSLSSVLPPTVQPDEQHRGKWTREGWTEQDAGVRTRTISKWFVMFINYCAQLQNKGRPTNSRESSAEGRLWDWWIIGCWIDQLLGTIIVSLHESYFITLGLCLNHVISRLRQSLLLVQLGAENEASWHLDVQWMFRHESY